MGINLINLNRLLKLVARPLSGGHPTSIMNNLIFRENEWTQAEQECWLVPRKDVVAGGLLYDAQKMYLDNLNSAFNAGYERENTLLDLVTVTAVRHVFKGEKYLGDPVTDVTSFFARSEILKRPGPDEIDPVEWTQPVEPFKPYCALVGFVEKHKDRMTHLFTLSDYGFDNLQKTNENIVVVALRKFKAAGK